jgi:hypothetical protein
MADICDGEPWTEMDVEDLTAALRSGSSIEEPPSIYVGQAQSKTFGARLKNLGC